MSVAEAVGAAAEYELGQQSEAAGDTPAAIGAYRRAIERDGGFHGAHRRLAVLLLSTKGRAASFDLFRSELLTSRDGDRWLQDLVASTMQRGEIALSGELASILAELRWSSRLFPISTEGAAGPIPVHPPEVFLTRGKLQHDIEQFDYLRRIAVDGLPLDALIRAYERTAARMPARPDARVPLDEREREAIGAVFNRMLHVRRAPRVRKALSDSWNPAAVQKAFLERPFGLVVVDDFLSPEALDGLQRFCMESTIWTANRYAHGRLGSFFHDGFNCPLLIQIAEELKRALPRVIVERYPLRQIWGFKNAPELPADSTNHADFAAVSVNFWITPTEANLDESSGGLIVYDVDAPLSWDFHTYNGRSDIIKPFLRTRNARATHIPYRCNRAMIFNSDLFHATAGLRFRPGYENRRINVTYLFGDRQDDVHHRNVGGEDGSPNGAPSWRSGAFRRR